MKLDNRLWIVIASILSLGLIAGGWFIGVNPQLQAAAASDEQRTTIDDQNEALRTSIAQLRAADENRAELETQLAELQKSVPPGIYGSQFLAEINDIVSSSGVVITSVALGNPSRYETPADPAAEAPVAASAEAPSETAAEDSADAAPVAPTGPEAPMPQTDGQISGANFIIVPVTIEVTGSTASVMAFTKSLQQGDRLVLVTKVDMTRERGDGGIADQFTLSLAGDMYVLETAASPTAQPAAADAGE